METAFYSEKDDIYFYIAGYHGCDNTMLAIEIANKLIGEINKLTKLLGVKDSDIKTDRITKSRRYKYMRVFYIQNAKANVLESELNTAFCIGGGWSMQSWIES